VILVTLPASRAKPTFTYALMINFRIYSRLQKSMLKEDITILFVNSTRMNSSRSVFGSNYPFGTCCSGVLGVNPQWGLNPSHRCLLCKKIVHMLCGVEEGDGQVLCVKCKVPIYNQYQVLWSTATPVAISLAVLPPALMDDSKDEPEYDSPTDLCDLNEAFNSPEPPTMKDKPSTPHQQFLAMDDEDIATAKCFVNRWGKLASEKVEWEIVADGDNVNLGMTEIDNHDPIQEIPYTTNTTLDEIFFEHLMPDITGHGKLIDEYLADQRSEYHITVINEKIAFHDLDASNQDWWVKQCFTLLIAAGYEMEDGADNLWKSGPATGHCEYPDFGQYRNINMFKAFRSAVPMAWTGK
jgi:hypothetical protein